MKMFQAPFSFNGRIRRTEFGLSYIIYTIFVLIISFVQETYPDFSFIVILYIPMLWFLYAQGAKRCHDRGNSGWYQIIPFYVLWMLFGMERLVKMDTD